MRGVVVAVELAAGAGRLLRAGRLVLLRRIRIVRTGLTRLRYLVLREAHRSCRKAGRDNAGRANVPCWRKRPFIPFTGSGGSASVQSQVTLPSTLSTTCLPSTMISYRNHLLSSAGGVSITSLTL